MKKSESEREFLKTVGKRLREMRIRRRFTQGQLAEEAGAAQNQISRYEAGLSAMSLHMVYRLALVLDVPASYLLDDNSLTNNGEPLQKELRLQKELLQFEIFTAAEKIKAEVSALQDRINSL